jgi:hypothetical protein
MFDSHEQNQTKLKKKSTLLEDDFIVFQKSKTVNKASTTNGSNSKDENN